MRYAYWFVVVCVLLTVPAFANTNCAAGSLSTVAGLLGLAGAVRRKLKR